jgi:hypothetical protein
MENEKCYKEPRKRNILHTTKSRMVNWISHIFHRNCVLKQVIEGKMKGRRGSRRKHLLDKLTERRRCINFKEEALDHSVWKTCFAISYGPDSRQTT